MGNDGSKSESPEKLSKALSRASLKRENSGSVGSRYHRLPRRLQKDYQLLGVVLGEGYHGQVYLAKAIGTDTNKKFAVKPFKLTGVDTEALEDLANEAEIYLGMDHPHIARLVDVYESEDQLSLVMECMSGGELLKRVQTRKRFSEKDAVEASWQMLLAINYIHSHDIVHCDIKLENFLYESEESDYLKLIDFGFSKIWEKDTMLHESCGTLAYIAPEVIQESYTSQCDMWSLGVTVFIMLCGHLPFSSRNDGAMAGQILRGDVTTKQPVWSSISESGRDFVMKLLVVNPAQRMNASQALEHPWIAERDKLCLQQADVNEGVAAALDAFAQASAFRKVCLNAMAWSLTTEEQQQVREAFVEIDSEHKGAITLNEFKKVLEERFHFNDAHSRAVFEALDVDHEDEIHYSEFLAAMASARVHFHDELLRETFKRFDTDASGYITAHTLQQVLTDLPEGELKKLIGEADEDGDGRITFDEFARFMKKEGSQYHHVAGKILDDADHSASKSRKLQSKKVSKTPIPGDRKTKEDEKDWLLCCLAR